MAVVKHVQLPDESVVDINDVRVVSDAIVYYGSDEGSATNVETQYEETANKVTSMSSSSTNTQYPSAKAVYDALATKQDTLVSGTNIKTINNQSLLGPGNITIQGGGGGGIQGVKENGTLLTPDANSVVDVNVPVKIYEIGFIDYYDIVESNLTISNALSQELYDCIDEGITPIIRFVYEGPYPESYMRYDYLDFVYTDRQMVDGIYFIYFIAFVDGIFIKLDIRLPYGQNDAAISTVIMPFENTRNKANVFNSDTIDSTHYPTTQLVKDSLDAKQATLVSGTNIKTVNNTSLLGSGNINISADTSTCVHKTGDEDIAGDKSFEDNIEVVDASHILYSGSGGGGGGFTRHEDAQFGVVDGATLQFTVTDEPKAFVIASDLGEGSEGALMIVGDSTGCHGVYNTGSQHNYSAGFTKSYSNGTLTITAPSGISLYAENYNIVYYTGSGTLTFHTSQVSPGSGITAVTFTGTGLTEVPAMYACFLETAVNNEQYRRVAAYTNSTRDVYLGSNIGITFLTGGPVATTSSFSVSYNNGLYINSGGQNAGGYFHNPGTYVLYYLMASDVASGGGGGSGGYNSLKDELDGIRDTISGIETLLAAI